MENGDGDGEDGRSGSVIGLSRCFIVNQRSWRETVRFLVSTVNGENQVIIIIMVRGMYVYIYLWAMTKGYTGDNTRDTHPVAPPSGRSSTILLYEGLVNRLRKI